MKNGAISYEEPYDTETAARLVSNKIDFGRIHTLVGIASELFEQMPGRFDNNQDEFDRIANLLAEIHRLALDQKESLRQFFSKEPVPN